MKYYIPSVDIFLLIPLVISTLPYGLRSGNMTMGSERKKFQCDCNFPFRISQSRLLFTSPYLLPWWDCTSPNTPGIALLEWLLPKRQENKNTAGCEELKPAIYTYRQRYGVQYCENSMISLKIKNRIPQSLEIHFWVCLKKTKSLPQSIHSRSLWHHIRKIEKTWE